VWLTFEVTGRPDGSHSELRNPHPASLLIEFAEPALQKLLSIPAVAD
jgi:hypothetical protein